MGQAGDEQPECVLEARAPMRRELVAQGEPGLLRRLGSPLAAPHGEASMTSRLRLSEPRVAEDLASFLSRYDCRAEVAADGTVMVELPHVLHRDQARMELELYVRLWQAVHGTSVDFLD
jgi:hypothetical protein